MVILNSGLRKFMLEMAVNKKTKSRVVLFNPIDEIVECHFPSKRIEEERSASIEAERESSVSAKVENLGNRVAELEARLVKLETVGSITPAGAVAK